MYKYNVGFLFEEGPGFYPVVLKTSCVELSIGFHDGYIFSTPSCDELWGSDEILWVGKKLALELFFPECVLEKHHLDLDLINVFGS